jgi:plastocyanin
MRMLATMLFLVGCGGGGGGSSVDAAPDVPDVPLIRVDPCPATVDQEITAEVDRFVPMTATIAVGKVVKYELSTAHQLVPFPDTPADLTVPANTTRCFKFLKPGTYRYFCKFDSFAGSVVVQ